LRGGGELDADDDEQKSRGAEYTQHDVAVPIAAPELGSVVLVVVCERFGGLRPRRLR